MLKIIKGREPHTVKEFAIVYDDEHGTGFIFHCDERGNMKEMSKEAQANLEYCEAHPEEFARAGEMIDCSYTYIEPAHGKCSCGEEIILECDYDGACQCPKCGRWYNLYGQELLPPDQWEDDDPDDYEPELW